MTTGTGGEASLSGFSSRSYRSTVTQLPQRDEALMSELEPGFSNSAAADDKPSSVEAPASADAKVLDSSDVEDKAVKPAKTAAKRPAKKS